MVKVCGLLVRRVAQAACVLSHRFRTLAFVFRVRIAGAHGRCRTLSEWQKTPKFGEQTQFCSKQGSSWNSGVIDMRLSFDRDGQATSILQMLSFA